MAESCSSHLDEDGQPLERPDRTSTDTFEATMTSDQANTISLEAEDQAVLEAQSGDIDDIVEDCLSIRHTLGYRTEPAEHVAVALTTRQWKIALTVLDTNIEAWSDRGNTSDANTLRQLRNVITSQIGTHIHQT